MRRFQTETRFLVFLKLAGLAARAGLWWGGQCWAQGCVCWAGACPPGLLSPLPAVPVPMHAGHLPACSTQAASPSAARWQHTERFLGNGVEGRLAVLGVEPAPGRKPGDQRLPTPLTVSGGWGTRRPPQLQTNAVRPPSRLHSHSGEPELRDVGSFVSGCGG